MTYRNRLVTPLTDDGLGYFKIPFAGILSSTCPKTDDTTYCDSICTICFWTICFAARLKRELVSIGNIQIFPVFIVCSGYFCYYIVIIVCFS